MELNFLKAEWCQLKIDDDFYSFKYFFNENSYQLLVFDVDQFRLFSTKKNSDEILHKFNVNEIIEKRISL